MLGIIINMGNKAGRNRDRDRAPQTEAPVIKNHNNIRKETIKLTHISDEKYYLSFTFSCTYDCIITIYLCAMENRSTDESCPPVYFYTPDYVPEKPVSYKFSAGMRQKFPERACVIDISKFDQEDLTSIKENEYYPIVITIETGILSF
jgi:hypothetical protein